MEYVIGKRFYCKIKGCAKEVKDIGYPIPDVQQNQFELDNLLTKRSDGRERTLKRYEEIEIIIDEFDIF